MQELKNVPANSHLEIDLSKSIFIDFDVVEFLNNYRETAHLKNISVTVINPEKLEIERVPA
ncbi:MAG: hypothetical protein M3512_15845 [Bacteroidota bacterium]|nr:hypothetical protein [Bacteroidota bacterium]